MTVADIRKLLADVTPGPWMKCYDGSSDWTVGEFPDPQAKPICHLWSRDDEWVRNHAEFIAQSPEIVRFLLDRVEELERQIVEDMYEVQGYLIKVKDLELRYQITRDGWILRVLKDESQMKMTRALAEKWVDNTIEAEIKRLKEVK